MTHRRIYVDNLSGLRTNAPISPTSSKSTMDDKCMKIYHNVGILWDLMDHTELFASNPIFAERLPIRTSLVNAVASGGGISQIFKTFHDEFHRVETDVKTHKRRFAGMGTTPPYIYPDHEAVCGHSDKFMRTGQGGDAKPPPIPVKKLSKETSHNIFNKKKMYLTPCGVYDRTTIHKLVR